MSKVERSIVAALKEANLDYEITKGSKHNKVYVNGRMIGVFSGGAASCRDDKLFVSKIKKIKKA